MPSEVGLELLSSLELRFIFEVHLPPPMGPLISCFIAVLRQIEPSQIPKTIKILRSEPGITQQYMTDALTN